MAALFAGARVIGNLIRQQPARSRHLLRDLIERERRVFVRHDKFAGCMKRRVGRVGLDGQLIERDVIIREIERFGQFCAPRVRLLPGPRVNQIE